MKTMVIKGVLFMRSSNRKRFSLLVFTIILTFAVVVPASAIAGTTLYVDINDAGCNDITGAPYCSIQAAINAAITGDTIEVAAGTYAEALTVNKGVDINGAGEGVTIVDGSAVTTYNVSITADNVSVSNLTLLGNPSTGTYGFKASNVSNFSISNVTIDDCKRTGLDLNGVTGATISNVTVTDTASGNGIGVTDSTNVAINDVTTSNNAWGAIRVSSGGCCYGPGVDNFSISGTNSVAEDIKLYTEIDTNGGVITNFDPGQFDYETRNMTQFITWGKTWQALYYDVLDDAKTAALGYTPVYDSSIKQVSTGDMFMYPDMGIQAAIYHADAGATVHVAAGTYNTTNGHTSQVFVDKNIAVIGEDEATTIFKPTADTGTSADDRAWWLVDTGVDFDLSNVTLDGTGYLIFQAIRTKGSGFIQHVTFNEIKYNESGPNYSGFAVAAFGTGNVDIFSCTFSEIGRVGVLYYGTGISGSSYSYNTYTGKGDGDWLDYALDISAGATVTVHHNTVANNTGVASSDGSASAGYMATTFFGAGTTALIYENTILNNTVGIVVGYDGTDTSTVDAFYNRIVGNEYGIDTTAPAVNAENNWWGCNEGPGATDCDSASVGVDADPWLTLTVTSDVTQLDLTESTNITANTFINSDLLDTEGGLYQLQNGPEVTFTTDLGQITSPQYLTAGKAVAALTYDAAPAGKATAQATLDNETVSVQVVFSAYGDSVGVYNLNTAGFRLSNNVWYTHPDEMFMFGPAVGDWRPIAGDWDGDGTDTIGVYNMDNGQFYLRNSNDYGAPSIKFTWGAGASAWLPFAGDWNNDGMDTVGLYNPTTAEFKLCTANGACDPGLSFTYSLTSGVFLPVAGDWDGDGTDTIGLYKTDTSAFWLRNSNSSGAVDLMFAFGPRTVAWAPIAGDWNNDGIDTIGLYNDATGGFWLRDSNNYGSPDYRFMFGPAADTWLPIAGDWDNQ